MVEAKFERELKIFRREVEHGEGCLSAYISVNSAAESSKPVKDLLDKAPWFWNQCCPVN